MTHPRGRPIVALIVVSVIALLASTGAVTLIALAAYIANAPAQPRPASATNPGVIMLQTDNFTYIIDKKLVTVRPREKDDSTDTQD